MACFATPYGLRYAAHCFNRAHAQQRGPALIPAGGKLGVTSDYLTIKPMRHSVRINELSSVVTSNHPANWVPGKPFDRLELVSPTDRITLLPSFHQREELENLLRLIHQRRPEVFTDPQVLEFMDGGFGEWWRYR